MLLTQEQISQLRIILSILQQRSKDLQDTRATLASATLNPRVPIPGLRQATLAPRRTTQSPRLAIQVPVQWAFLSNTSPCIISKVDLQGYHGCQHHLLHQAVHQGWNI